MTFPPYVPILHVYEGDTFTQSFVFTTNGKPRDLVAEGWSSWIAQIRPEPSSGSHHDFVVDTSQANVGRITLELSKTVTNGLHPGVWDLQASAGSVTTTFIRGSVIVEKDISRV